MSAPELMALRGGVSERYCFGTGACYDILAAMMRVNLILRLAPRFADLLDLSVDQKLALDGFESISNGRPLGSSAFITRIEKNVCAR